MCRGAVQTCGHEGLPHREVESRMGLHCEGGEQAPRNSPSCPLAIFLFSFPIPHEPCQDLDDRWREEDEEEGSLVRIDVRYI